MLPLSWTAFFCLTDSWTVRNGMILPQRCRSDPDENDKNQCAYTRTHPDDLYSSVRASNNPICSCRRDLMPSDGITVCIRRRRSISLSHCPSSALCTKYIGETSGEYLYSSFLWHLELSSGTFLVEFMPASKNIRYRLSLVKDISSVVRIGINLTTISFISQFTERCLRSRLSW